jgi:ribosomal protein L11 methyltransferase
VGFFCMSKHFVEIDVDVNETFAEIIIAELAELGFDSFMDKENGILGYIDADIFQDLEVKQIFERYATKTNLHYSFKKVERQNWNSEWESNFSPIIVDDKIHVRATFHEPNNLQIEIIITPKMSFGTGHHETTHQVMSLQLGVDHKHKTVLDVGTGTGILAILAIKLGATKVHAFDIDEWSVENTLENIELNNTPNITVSQGTINDQILEKYDIVLANINRNILLDEISKYVRFMKPAGKLFVSGFYDIDAEDIISKASDFNLKLIERKSKNAWAAIVFELEQ